MTPFAAMYLLDLCREGRFELGCDEASQHGTIFDDSVSVSFMCGVSRVPCDSIPSMRLQACFTVDPRQLSDLPGLYWLHLGS